MSGWKAVRRGVGILFRSAPLATTVYVLQAMLAGVGPNVVIVASARLIGIAPNLASSADARRDAVMAVTVIAIGLAITQGATALSATLWSYVVYRFQAAFDSLRISAVSALPGLEHFESPHLADRLHASATWASSGPTNLFNYSVSLMRWLTQGIGGLLIIGRLGWWAPALIAGGVRPSGLESLEACPGASGASETSFSSPQIRAIPCISRSSD